MGHVDVRHEAPLPASSETQVGSGERWGGYFVDGRAKVDTHSPTHVATTLLEQRHTKDTPGEARQGVIGL